jgi:hypothetical protein
VLSSYHPRHWHVKVGAGASIARVILNGFYQHSSEVPKGVVVESFYYAEGKPSLVTPPDRYPGELSKQLIDVVQTKTNLPMSSFRGCIGATYFRIERQDTDNLTPGVLRAPEPVKGCESVKDEPFACLTIGTENVYKAKKNYLFVHAAGANKNCRGPELKIAGWEAHPHQTMLWSGDSLFVCHGKNGVLRVSTKTGALLDTARFPCDAIMKENGTFLVRTQKSDPAAADEYHRAASFADLKAGNTTVAYKGKRTFTFMSSFGGSFYGLGTWESPHTLWKSSFASLQGATLPKGYALPDKVRGMLGFDALTGERAGLLYARDTRYARQLMMLRLVNGVWQKEFEGRIDAKGYGLSCRAR